jgi:transcriptional regulator with XRE-family HTH domain
MAERSSWSDVRRRRMREPGAEDSYQAVHLAYELGSKVRDLREQRGWSQTALARAAGMTQPVLARFESGGTVPTLPVLERLACALDVHLVVQLTSHTTSPRESRPTAQHRVAG